MSRHHFVRDTSEGCDLKRYRLFTFLSGTPTFVVCDNLKAAVSNPDRYDPGLNRTYAEMASHYGTAILAARPRRPKDKAKVEVAVQIAQRWILARLRNQRFFSRAELNAAIKTLVDELNARQMRGFGSSRAELFAELDKPKLTPLPDQPYAFARWKRCRLAPDYHVEVDGHWYSAPYRLIGELVDARIDDRTVEIFHKGQRIASHARAPNRRGHTTIADHMPSAHRRYGKWTPAAVIAAGERIGPSTAAFFQAVIDARPHPEQGFRTCLGILALVKSYGAERLDAACRRGILIKARSVASIRSILQNGLDRTFFDESFEHQPLRHGNIRGRDYFH
ncbi:transposase [Bradyrhizobium huanghuaihaiense]